MTQEELGSRLGINRAAVNKYEKGTVVNIPVNTLLKLCDIFDVTPNYLILGQAEFEIENIRKEIKRMLGENGAKCFSTLEMLSEEGFLHAIPYLEDMIKLYPATVKKMALSNNLISNSQYSEKQAIETLPLSNRAINVLLRNSIFCYDELLAFYRQHSFYDLNGAGKSTVEELGRFITHATNLGSKTDDKAMITITQAFPENRFKAFCQYCKECGIANLEELNTEKLLDFQKSRNVDLGYVVRVFSRYYVLLHCDNTDASFDVSPETLDSPITILNVFRRMSRPITDLIDSNILTMRDFSSLELSNIRSTIGERAYAENYDIFKMLQKPLKVIFELVFPFVEADSNWKVFSEYCELGSTTVAEKRNIVRQRVYQEGEKARNLLAPIVSAIAKNEIQKLGVTSIEILELCDLLGGKLSPDSIFGLLNRESCFKISSGRLSLEK